MRKKCSVLAPAGSCNPRRKEGALLVLRPRRPHRALRVRGSVPAILRRSAGFPTCRIADFQSACRRGRNWYICGTKGWGPIVFIRGCSTIRQNFPTVQNRRKIGVLADFQPTRLRCTRYLQQIKIGVRRF